MARRNQTRYVGQISYTANQRVPFDLFRRYPTRGLVLRLNGSYTISTAGAPVIYTGGPGAVMKVIKRIEVIADGRDTIKSISGDELFMKNQLLYGTRPQVTQPAITSAAHTCGGTFYLPFEMPKSVRPLDTLLDSGRLQTLQLFITYGQATDMFSTNPTTISAEDFPITVHQVEAIRHDGKPEAYASYKEHAIETPITAASTEMHIDLPPGNTYRGMLIECESDGEMVDTILNRVQIKSGSDVYFDMYEEELRGFNAIKMDMQDQARTGYYYIDFCPDGQMVDVLDAVNLTDLRAVVDVSHPGTTDRIRFIPCEFIPASAAQIAMAQGAQAA